MTERRYQRIQRVLRHRQPDLTLLFGGHNELYLIAGVAGAAYATWWFGWFDRKT